MKHFKLLGIILLTVFTAILIGCGSSDNSDSAAATSAFSSVLTAPVKAAITQNILKTTFVTDAIYLRLGTKTGEGQYSVVPAGNTYFRDPPATFTNGSWSEAYFDGNGVAITPPLYGGIGANERVDVTFSNVKFADATYTHTINGSFSASFVDDRNACPLSFSNASFLAETSSDSVLLTLNDTIATFSYNTQTFANGTVFNGNYLINGQKILFTATQVSDENKMIFNFNNGAESQSFLANFTTGELIQTE